MSPDKAAKVQVKMRELMARGKIRHSTSKFTAPIVVVGKPDGGIRVSVNYDALNRATVHNPFDFPKIDDIISEYGGCHFLSKLDLKDGFVQVGQSEHTRQFAAFLTPTDHFEPNDLPFGWKSSPHQFQRIVTHALGPLLSHRRIHPYLDDITIGTKTKDECEHLTFLVMACLANSNFTINEKKSILVQPSIVLLGRLINGETKTTRQVSVDKVKSMLRPVDRKGVQQLAGLFGYFRDFIPNYAKYIRPIDRLKRKNVPFNWDVECESSFKSMVSMIAAEPCLHHPHYTLPFELHADASLLGAGTMLAQVHDSKPKHHQIRVIGFFSKTFTPSQVKYHTSDKECLAVVLSLKYFRSFFEGRHVTVYSDHDALQYLLSGKEAKGRQARWQIFLNSFDIDIKHVKGVDNAAADALSRLCLDRPDLVASALMS